VDEQWDLGYDQTKKRSKNETKYGKDKAVKNGKIPNILSVKSTSEERSATG
jgi:hypothetical protein